MHGIERKLEARVEQAADGIEVELRLHEVGVVLGRIHDLYGHAAESGFTNLAEVNWGHIQALVGRDGPAAGIDSIRQGRWCLAPAAHTEFDSEVAIRSGGVVAGGEHKAPMGVVLADQM